MLTGDVDQRSADGDGGVGQSYLWWPGAFVRWSLLRRGGLVRLADVAGQAGAKSSLDRRAETM